jgi:hypothetical protein
MGLACLGLGYLYFLAFNVSQVLCTYLGRNNPSRKGAKQAGLEQLSGQSTECTNLSPEEFLAPFFGHLSVTYEFYYSKVVSALNMNCRFLLPAHWVEGLTLSSSICFFFPPRGRDLYFNS